MPKATTTKELPPPFTAYACDRLRRLRAKRVKALKDEGELKKERKALEEQLDELGKDDSPEKRKLAAQYWETIRALERARADIQFFADKIDTTIEDADQMELIPGMNDVDDPPEEIYRRPRGGKGSKAAGDGDDEDDDRPVGEPEPEPQTKKPSPRPGPDLKLARPAGEPWHDIDVGDVRLPERVAQALRNAELPSLGAVENRGGYRLSTIGGVSPKDEHYLEQLILALREGKSREDAIFAAEAALENAPKGGKRSKKA